MKRMTWLPLLILAVTLTACDKKEPFNASKASGEIQGRIGASLEIFNISKTVICGNELTSGKVCVGHRSTAYQARTEVDTYMATTDAEPVGDWTVNDGIYMRLWKYDGDRVLNTFSVIVSSDLLVLDW